MIHWKYTVLKPEFIFKHVRFCKSHYLSSETKSSTEQEEFRIKVCPQLQCPVSKGFILVVLISFQIQNTYNNFVFIVVSNSPIQVKPVCILGLLQIKRQLNFFSF